MLPQVSERRREGVERKKKRTTRRGTERKRELRPSLLVREVQELGGQELPVVTSLIFPSKRAVCLRAMSNLKLAFKQSG